MLRVCPAHGLAALAGKLSLARCGNQLFFLCILASQIAGKVDIFVLSRVLTDLEFI